MYADDLRVSLERTCPAELFSAPPKMPSNVSLLGREYWGGAPPFWRYDASSDSSSMMCCLYVSHSLMSSATRGLSREPAISTCRRSISTLRRPISASAFLTWPNCSLTSAFALSSSSESLSMVACEALWASLLRCCSRMACDSAILALSSFRASSRACW
ncbi:hypothetical protein BKA81DRAFT_94657 [Phyllosticta paracitricarpa]